MSMMDVGVRVWGSMCSIKDGLNLVGSIVVRHGVSAKGMTVAVKPRNAT